MNFSEELSTTVPWGEHELMNSFLYSNMGKLWLKFVSIQVGPPHVAQLKQWRKFTKSSTKTGKVPFQRSLAG